MVDENLLVGVWEILVTKFYKVLKSRTVRWTGHVARMESLVEQHEGMRGLGRGWLVWARNIKRGRKKWSGRALTRFVCLRSRDTWRASLNTILNYYVHVTAHRDKSL